MRSTRATELIEIYPAHVVNAWMEHTEAVAMANYRQMGKAIDKFFDDAAGELDKKGGKMVGEHAGKGENGIGTAKAATTQSFVSQTLATKCKTV